MLVRLKMRRGIDRAHRWRDVPRQVSTRSRWGTSRWWSWLIGEASSPGVQLESCRDCGLTRITVRSPGLVVSTDEHYFTGLPPLDWRGQALDRCDAADLC